MIIVAISPIHEKKTIGADWNTARNVQFGTIKERNTDRIAFVNKINATDILTIMANCTIDLMIVSIILNLVVTLAESNYPYALVKLAYGNHTMSISHKSKNDSKFHLVSYVSATLYKLPIVPFSSAEPTTQNLCSN